MNESKMLLRVMRNYNGDKDESIGAAQTTMSGRFLIVEGHELIIIFIDPFTKSGSRRIFNLVSFSRGKHFVLLANILFLDNMFTLTNNIAQEQTRCQLSIRRS